ncbi:MAG: VWA domain-containing protein [Oligoflexia bacterium]|nr:VWA domain-containing protein [Oligoflexia bacterium]
MKTTLYVIVDISGSMNEMGKIHLQRNLCRYSSQLKTIDQEKYANIEIHFFQWATTISEIIIQSNGDIPLLIAEGTSDLDHLFDFLSAALNRDQTLRVLIFSDGNFEKFSDVLAFQKKLSTIPNLILKTIAVGADADLQKLKKISSGNNVFLAENIASAIDSILFGMNKCIVVAPEYLNQIKISQSLHSKDY